MSSKFIQPIGFIVSDFKEKFGIPRQSGRINNLSQVRFYPPFCNKDAFREIEKFSHLWLIFGFSAVPEKDFSPTVRPPRLGGNRKVGVFSSRSPFRPNGLGLSAVKLVGLNEDEKGTFLTVMGADLLDGTPVYDVKPYVKKYDSIICANDGFIDEYQDKKLCVKIPENLKILLGDKAEILTEILSEDPRPAWIESLVKVIPFSRE